MNTIPQLVADTRATLSRQDFRRVAVLVVLLLGMGVCAQAQDATTVAGALQTTVNPYVTLGIRLFGGLVAIGGFVVAFQGFTGREEGFDKVFKIGTGLIGIALGTICISQTATITQWLALANAFSAGT